ncbi:MAG: polysaccharide biosynthesis protein [Bacteroidetes bacterium]|nr:polysaccharide biosynthesis protein [Bacteroidota bacterium]MDA1121093.1 polysaccharide biosynthesis protein [Bacteroidota bacterium]
MGLFLPFKFIMLKDKKILITGGTGILGRGFVRSFVRDHPEIGEIRVMARDESKHYQFSLEFPPDRFPKIRNFIGDVRDFDRLKDLSTGVDVLIHAAAMKHLYYCESNPGECLKTNSEGTRNVVKAAIENNVSKSVFISTDKAVEPISVYGNSKQAAEKIFQSRSNQNSKFSIMRFGNIWGSSGSVLPHFMALRVKGNLPLKHASSTRFFGTVHQAFKTLLFAIETMQGGEVYIPKWQSVKIMDMAKIVGSNKCKISITHLENYEKVHEKLMADNEKTRAFENKEHLLIPNEDIDQDRALDVYQMLKAGFVNFSSDNPSNLLEIEMLEKVLEPLMASIDSRKSTKTH